MAEENIIVNPFGETLDEILPIYRTYRMDFNKHRIAGMVEGIDAAQQAATKILLTKRFAHQIYDDQYGCDLLNKIGNAALTREYLEADIPAMIEDALSTEEMIQAVEDVDFNILDNDGAELTVYLKTIFGDAEVEGVIVDGR